MISPSFKGALAVSGKGCVVFPLMRNSATGTGVRAGVGVADGDGKEDSDGDGDKDGTADGDGNGDEDGEGDGDVATGETEGFTILLTSITTLARVFKPKYP